MKKPRVSETKHPRYAWRVFFTENGIRKNSFFESKAEATTFAEQTETEVDNHGQELAAMPNELRIEAINCNKRVVAVGATLTQAVDFFLKHAKPWGGTRLVKFVVEEFINAKKQAGRRPEYIRIQSAVLGKFSRHFGEQPIHEIGTPKINEWMLTQNWTLRTRLNYQHDLRNLFGFAKKHGYCAIDPTKQLEAPRLDEPPPGILTISQATKLLNAAQYEPLILPFIAIGLFAGLRTSELLRLDWSEVDMSEKVIEVSAKKAKSRARRIVEMSENLLLWLRPYVKQTGAVVSNDVRILFKNIRDVAEIKEWPKNAMRHSFGSYHLAFHKNAPRTSLEMGHDNPEQLFQSYRELVKPKDAEQYWKIMPKRKSKKIVPFKAA
jgi:integrase